MSKNKDQHLPAWFLGASVFVAWFVTICVAFWMGGAFAAPRYTQGCPADWQGEPPR